MYEDYTGKSNKQGVHKPKRQSYSSIGWYGKKSPTIEYGSWFVSPKPFNGMEIKGWGTTRLESGDFVLTTHRLRSSVIASRFRWVVKQNRKKTFYPEFTKREDMAQGKMTGHRQNLIITPYHDELMVMGLLGASKNLSWDNDKSYGVGKNLDVGCCQKLDDYLRVFNEVVEKDGFDPLGGWFTSFWIDFVPCLDSNNKAEWVDLYGYGETNPFTIDMSLSEKIGLPRTRFVGEENHEKFQQLRLDVGIPWEQEWEGISGESEDIQQSSSYQNDEPQATEEDEIPF